MTASKKHVTILLGLVLMARVAVNSFAYTRQNLAKEAKISIEQARAKALKAHPGKITDEELEQEKGGSGLRYSFDIQQGKITQHRKSAWTQRPDRDWKTPRKAPTRINLMPMDGRPSIGMRACFSLKRKAAMARATACSNF